MRIQDFLFQGVIIDGCPLSYIEDNYEDPHYVIKPILWKSDIVFDSIHEIRWMIEANV